MEPHTIRKCPRCLAWKPLVAAEWYWLPSGRLYHYCRACRVEASREDKRRHPGRVRAEDARQRARPGRQAYMRAYKAAARAARKSVGPST